METRKALWELCDNFHQTTGNMQPLSSDLDLEWYAALVNENELAVEHYRRMHQMGLDNSEFIRRLKGATTKTSKERNRQRTATKTRKMPMICGKILTALLTESVETLKKDGLTL